MPSAFTVPNRFKSLLFQFASKKWTSATKINCCADEYTKNDAFYLSNIQSNNNKQNLLRQISIFKNVTTSFFLQQTIFVEIIGFYCSSI